MAALGYLLFLITAIFVYYLLYESVPDVPELEETWWGHGNNSTQDTSIRQFKINVSQKVLDDLKYRLKHHRPFTPPLEGIQHQYGINTNYLKEVIDYWLNKYDWSKRQTLLNNYDQYVTNIQGLDIHFVRVSPKRRLNGKTIPLLLLHGWPGNAFEMAPFLQQIMNQENGKIIFDVIAPDLPGFAFSQAATKPGLGACEMALVLKNLMKRLDFDQFYGQGGDFGAYILRCMSVLYPESLIAFHSNMCTVYTKKTIFKTLVGTIIPSYVVETNHYDRVYPLKDKIGVALSEGGYFHLQATKPDTIGVALGDSPVGLAAYIFEKFITLTRYKFLEEKNVKLQDLYDFDQLLDVVMIHWVTNSMTTAMRLYAESFNVRSFNQAINRLITKIPVACARFRNDFYTPDIFLKTVLPNIVQISDFEGGHFAAMENADVLYMDFYSAVLRFEDFYNNQTRREL